MPAQYPKNYWPTKPEDSFKAGEIYHVALGADNVSMPTLWQITRDFTVGELGYSEVWLSSPGLFFTYLQVDDYATLIRSLPLEEAVRLEVGIINQWKDRGFYKTPGYFHDAESYHGFKLLSVEHRGVVLNVLPFEDSAYREWYDQHRKIRKEDGSLVWVSFNGQKTYAEGDWVVFNSVDGGAPQNVPDSEIDLYLKPERHPFEYYGQQLANGEIDRLHYTNGAGVTVEAEAVKGRVEYLRAKRDDLTLTELVIRTHAGRQIEVVVPSKDVQRREIRVGNEVVAIQTDQGNRVFVSQRTLRTHYYEGVYP